jgi:glutathione synthase
MDALESIRVGHDTTFALMLEAQRRGCDVLYFCQSDLGWHDATSVARMRTVEVRNRVGNHFTVLAENVLPLAELDVLFLRKDPPVDVAFLHATQLVELARGAGGKPFIVNTPAGLRTVNEKLFMLNFPDCIPRTLVSRDRHELRAFVESCDEGAVLKPLDGFGGRGILRAHRHDFNLNSILEIVTEVETRHIMAQQYLPAAVHGDKRVLVLDGEVLGAILRVARTDEFRCNIAAGGQVRRCELSERELLISARVGKRLREEGILFSGLDFIGEHLTEINVTSPTGLVELETLTEARAAARVLDRVLAERN